MREDFGPAVLTIADLHSRSIHYGYGFTPYFTTDSPDFRFDQKRRTRMDSSLSLCHGAGAAAYHLFLSGLACGIFGDFERWSEGYPERPHLDRQNDRRGTGAALEPFYPRRRSFAGE